MRPQRYRGYAIRRRSVVGIYFTTEILAYEYENTNWRSPWTSGVDVSRYFLIHLLGRQAKVSIFKTEDCPICGRRTNAFEKTMAKYNGLHLCRQCLTRIIASGINAVDVKKHTLNELQVAAGRRTVESLSVPSSKPATDSASFSSNSSATPSTAPDTSISGSAFESHSPGRVELHEIYVAPGAMASAKSKFIAFDVETTGLSEYADRIVEIGAIRFEDCKPTRSFSTLVNPGVRISVEASRINHISNEMLGNAPSENQAYEQFVEFLGDALAGNSILCAHNARFDMGFLKNTLERLGYSGTINYVDTLSLSRRLISDLPNYKQPTVAQYFNIQNNAEHRAYGDAEVCGMMFCKLASLGEQRLALNREERGIPNLTDVEKEIGAWIQKTIVDNGGDLSWFALTKSKSGYVSARYLYSFLRFKVLRKGPFLIVKDSANPPQELVTASCTASEGGDAFVRVFFKTPSDLSPMSDYIVSEYRGCRLEALEYIEENSRHRRKARLTMENYAGVTFSDAEMEDLLQSAIERHRKELEDERAEQREAEKKARRREARERRKHEAINGAAESKPARNNEGHKRPIAMMDDDENEISRFESVSAAAKEVGVSTKSIRDAAKGIQQHAGGYRWKYLDE